MVTFTEAIVFIKNWTGAKIRTWHCRLQEPVVSGEWPNPNCGWNTSHDNRVGARQFDDAGSMRSFGTSRINERGIWTKIRTSAQFARTV